MKTMTFRELVERVDERTGHKVEVKGMTETVLAVLVELGTIFYNQDPRTVLDLLHKYRGRKENETSGSD